MIRKRYAAIMAMVGLLLTTLAAAPGAVYASEQGRKNTTIALGAAAIYSLLKGKSTQGLILGAGTVYAYLGSAAWSATLTPADADAAITGTSTAARFGHVMASPGDLDGDGGDEIVVGAPGGYDQVTTGAVVIFGDLWSRVATTADADVVIDGADVTGWFGRSVATGDLDGDGLDDLVVGAPAEEGGAGADDLGMAGLTTTPIELEAGTTTSDLVLNVQENGAGLDGFVEYNTDLFAASSIERMLFGAK